MDGNVFRILSRIYLVESPIDTTLGKKEFKALADDLLNIKEPASHNQAMMNFGATICTPRLPNCTDCPIQIHCKSYHELDNVTLLPIKEKKIKRRTRHIFYIVSFNEHKYIFNKRTEQDIWKDLFDFPILLEENKKTTKKAINLALANIGINEHPAITTITQQLTHQTINAHFLTLTQTPSSFISNIYPKSIISKPNDVASPKVINLFLEKK